MLYSHKCEKCGHAAEEFRPASEYDKLPLCPTCQVPMPRDFIADHGAPRNAEAPEYLSDALGVHPDQIAEARKAFPHHEFAPDGRMIIRNAQHRNRVMKDLGYVEYTKNDLKYG